MISAEQKTRRKERIGDVTNGDFSGMDFHGYDCSGANLHGCKFVGANLRECEFEMADIEGADLTGVIASDASFVAANLQNATLVNADLRNSEFSGADLRGANFTGAKLKGAFFFAADIEGAQFSRPPGFEWLDANGEELIAACHVVLPEDEIGDQFRPGAEVTVEGFCDDISHPTGNGIYLGSRKYCEKQMVKTGKGTLFGCFFRRSEMVIPLGSIGEFRVPWVSVIWEVSHGR